jgi:hypothetical protein
MFSFADSPRDNSTKHRAEKPMHVVPEDATSDPVVVAASSPVQVEVDVKDGGIHRLGDCCDDLVRQRFGCATLPLLPVCCVAACLQPESGFLPVLCMLSLLLAPINLLIGLLLWPVPCCRQWATDRIIGAGLGLAAIAPALCTFGSGMHKLDDNMRAQSASLVRRLAYCVTFGMVGDTEWDED